MNASLLTNLPLASKKCPGLNLSGVSHSFLSNSTDVRLGINEVPYTTQGALHIFICIDLIEHHIDRTARYVLLLLLLHSILLPVFLIASEALCKQVHFEFQYFYNAVLIA